MTDPLHIRIDPTGVSVLQTGKGSFLVVGNSADGVARKAIHDLIQILMGVDSQLKSKEYGACAVGSCTNPRQGFSAQCEHHNNYK